MQKYFCDWCHREIVNFESSVVKVETGKGGTVVTLNMAPREFCSTQCASDALQDDAIRLKYDNLLTEHMNRIDHGVHSLSFVELLEEHGSSVYVPRVEPPFTFRDHLD